MKNKNHDEELQSRREFFKKAAKGALPILGAILLANTPVLSQASEKEPMGCSDDGCSYTCSTSCARACRGTCDALCRDSCYNSCNGSSK